MTIVAYIRITSCAAIGAPLDERTQPISVAMAVCNGERFLSEQIDSILCQMGKSDELVISLDDSTDSSEAILDAYRAKDARVKLYRNIHPGIATNFCNALERCTGHFIFLSDQDDVWMSHKIESVVEQFEVTGCDMVIHNGIHTDEHLNRVGTSFFELYRIGDSKARNFLRPRVSGCCMAFNRKILDAILPIPPKGVTYDHWIGMIAECLGTISYLDDILLEHRLHNENATCARRPITQIAQARLSLLVHLVPRLLRSAKEHS